MTCRHQSIPVCTCGQCLPTCQGHEPPHAKLLKAIDSSDLPQWLKEQALNLAHNCPACIEVEPECHHREGRAASGCPACILEKHGSCPQ